MLVRLLKPSELNDTELYSKGMIGLPFKKLCEFCKKEIEKGIYLVHYIRCKHIHTTQVTSSSSPLAKKPRIDLNK
uniref:Uncharacterized protein n=1 Tax=Meloidogyne incognita TaxID=6306 RepID=A0A914MDR3_MELIC